jgi:hypothetical protein
MSLSGSRGIIRASRIPSCFRQAAMVVDRVDELQFYAQYTGSEYQGEYGERLSARRRGSKFERVGYENNAAELRRILAPRFGYDPDEMYVRNLAEEVPGPPSTMRAARLTRMAKMAGDLAKGRTVPGLLIQPQLRVPVRPDAGYSEFIAPDFMVLDPVAGMWLPGEMKSFIEREGVADRADLDLTRRQAAVQYFGLRALAERFEIADRVTQRAIFVFATPYGLKLGPPHEERIDAECREVARAIEILAAAHAKLAALREVEETSLTNLIDEFPTDFQENCQGTCILAGPCAQEAARTARELGDDARELVGAGMDLNHLLGLARGQIAPADQAEQELTVSLADAISVLEALEARRAA